jgi:serine/threonine protein kinase
VSDFNLTDFEIVRELPPSEHRQQFLGKKAGQHDLVLLTAFSPEISQRPEFRRALKTDRAMLTMLQHQAIVRFLGADESNGQLLTWSESCEFEPLSAQLAQGRQFSSEDIIEIGWQLCSALQQSHNLGLAHGGLCPEVVRISDNLQVCLTDFGVARWISAVRKTGSETDTTSALITISALASREEVEKDLKDLADLLQQLFSNKTSSEADPTSARSATESLLEKLLQRASSANVTLRPASAREFQGRLGEILIGSDGDSIPLVDHRESTGKSRRSIVDELFEPAYGTRPSVVRGDGSAGTATTRRILPIVLVVVVLIVLTIIAGLMQ